MRMNWIGPILVLIAIFTYGAIATVRNSIAEQRAREQHTKGVATARRARPAAQVTPDHLERLRGADPLLPMKPWIGPTQTKADRQATEIGSLNPRLHRAE